MEVHIELATFALIILIIYSLKIWAFKGELFHPGLIYTLVNSSIFIIFAFGPYTYQSDIPWLYYYFYALITVAFIVGIRLGEKKKLRRFVKDIKLKRKHLLILSLLVIAPILLLIINSGILSEQFSLEGSASNRLYQVSLTQLTQERVNLFEYILKIIFASFTVISTSIFLVSSFQFKNYFFILIWLLSSILIALLSNSRTLLITQSLIVFVALYTLKKDAINQLTISLSKKFKILFKKTYTMLLFLAAIVMILFIVLTNARTEVRSATTQAGEAQQYELLEVQYQAQQKTWFTSAINNLPESLVNPIAELSMYAGGTVATGGVTTRIVSETGWHTWGLRNFFVVHRVLAQLNLDGGFSDFCRDNWYKIQGRTLLEIPAIGSGWLGDPGNLILDFGYIGAPLASLVTGLMIGWLYSRFSRSGSVIQATATSIFAIPMILTPSLNFFSLHVSNTLNYLILLAYFLRKSKRIDKNIFYFNSMANLASLYESKKR